MSLFDEKNQVKSQWIKWGKKGDYLQGTLLDVREMKSQMPGKENELVKVYEFMAHEGSFHALDENKQVIEAPVLLQKGEVWTLGGKASIDNQMRNIKRGQIFGVRYQDDKPAKTKGFNPLKVIKVYAGEMDPEYQGQSVEDMAHDAGIA